MDINSFHSSGTNNSKTLATDSYRRIIIGNRGCQGCYSTQYRSGSAAPIRKGIPRERQTETNLNGGCGVACDCSGLSCRNRLRRLQPDHAFRHHNRYRVFHCWSICRHSDGSGTNTQGFSRRGKVLSSPRRFVKVPPKRSVRLLNGLHARTGAIQPVQPMPCIVLSAAHSSVQPSTA